jgi:ATP-dependent protease ClpP protease subunit
MKIYVCGDINEDAFQSFSEQLDQAERNKKLPTIEVIINSGGGSGIDGLAFYDRIKAYPGTVNCTVYGACWSAAVFIMIACKRRRMGSNAWIMVHEDETSVKHLSTSKGEQEFKQQRLYENQWCLLLSNCTMKREVFWERLSRETTYLDSRSAFNYGLATEVI